MNSSSAEAPLIIPEVDVNATVPVVEENATVSADGTVRNNPDLIFLSSDEAGG